MRVGIDLGSRTIKVATLVDGVLQDFRVEESGFEPHRQALEMVGSYKPGKITATGYGRHLAHKHFAQDVITEIKAHALGARHYYPDCMTILDVGGQDCKVIVLNQSGKVANFQMNDKCAAGTGRFLEIMAASLGYTIKEFGEAAMTSHQDVVINSMCTVFAESEVISMKNSGIKPADIARAVHLSVTSRLVGMLNRIGYKEKVVFSGGVANNPCIVKMLEERLQIPVFIPETPDIVGALGAAIHAGKNENDTLS
ncbi:MAG: 3-hydroxyacyl-ACP dehydratase [Desulfobulbaceae bacterium]|nr:3-hydroxyacyl-ACP dehydratase [Desulfobulbaceae bacterium]